MNEDIEPMQVDQLGPQLDPSTTELTTRKPSSTQLVPTSAPMATQGHKEGTQSTKAQIGV